MGNTNWNLILFYFKLDPELGTQFYLDMELKLKPKLLKQL
jgi:hypothetical protein